MNHSQMTTMPSDYLLYTKTEMFWHDDLLVETVKTFFFLKAEISTVIMKNKMYNIFKLQINKEILTFLWGQ